jgi:hypothetical protein
MPYLTALYHRIRQTRALAELRHHNALLAGEAATLSEIAALLRRELRSTQAQLNASRAEHCNTLRRLEATEHDYYEVCAELAQHREAARTWITRTITPRVECN